MSITQEQITMNATNFARYENALQRDAENRRADRIYLTCRKPIDNIYSIFFVVDMNDGREYYCPINDCIVGDDFCIYDCGNNTSSDDESDYVYCDANINIQDFQPL